jgi:hypothetical protein
MIFAARLARVRSWSLAAFTACSTAPVSERSTDSVSFMRMCFSRRAISSSRWATCFSTRGCISAVTVPVNRWMAVFSPQPRQAPSPQGIEP